MFQKIRNVFKVNNNIKQNDLHLARLMGTFAGVCGLSLFIDKKDNYTENEKIYRDLNKLIFGLSSMTTMYHLLRHLKK
jgi:hypothetical protein